MVWAFSSARVRAESGPILRDRFEAALAPLKPGKPLHRKRDYDLFRFWYAVPYQLDAWGFPSWALPSNEVGAFLTKYHASFEQEGPDQARGLGESALRLLREPLPGLESGNLTLYADNALHIDRDSESSRLTLIVRPSPNLGASPDDLIEPWRAAPGATINTSSGDQPCSLDGETVARVAKAFAAREIPTVTFIAPASEVEDGLYRAIAARLETGVDEASCNFGLGVERFRETLDDLLARLPGFLDTSFWGNYRKRFDPYARPSEADEGRTVRFPLFAKIPDRGPLLQIDVVHAPIGDCFYEIQVARLGDRRKVPKDLEKLLAKLDAPYEIWEGEPWKRWE